MTYTLGMFRSARWGALILLLAAAPARAIDEAPTLWPGALLLGRADQRARQAGARAERPDGGPGDEGQRAQIAQAGRQPRQIDQYV